MKNGCIFDHVYSLTTQLFSSSIELEWANRPPYQQWCPWSGVDRVRAIGVSTLFGIWSEGAVRCPHSRSAVGREAGTTCSRDRHATSTWFRTTRTKYSDATPTNRQKTNIFTKVNNNVNNFFNNVFAHPSFDPEKYYKYGELKHGWPTLIH